MKKVGIIAEYNPFHNGHIYHLRKVQELFPDAAIILVLSSHFTQRGIPSILNKWDKTWICLQYGVDLVIELPFAFSSQSADFFAQGAIEILNAVGVDTFVFGSEENNIETLIELANTELYHPKFSALVQRNLNLGNNFPTALNKTLKELCNKEVNTPNDLLGLSYIKEIIKQNANITPISIQRTNNYHNDTLEEIIASATSIRKAIIEKREITTVVPAVTAKLLKQECFLLEDYFPFLKYQIYTDTDLSRYLDVDEGIENRIKKYIDQCTSFENLITCIKTKRYTYNKINRMLIHILCGFTKELKEELNHVSYLRILGFSKRGQQVLHEIKKTSPLPIYTTFQKGNIGFELEKKITAVYAMPLENEKRNKLIAMEYQRKPIRKEDSYV